MFTKRTLLLGVAVLSMLAGTTGCSIVLPANGRSFDLEGERITLRMINKGKLCGLQNELNKDRSEGQKVMIGPEGGDACAKKPEEVAFVAPIAAAAVGLAVDFVKKQLAEEATRYEAQFGTRIAQQRFWVLERKKDKGGKDTLAFGPGYDGFQLIRETKDYSLKGEGPAFRMICAFQVADDGSAFLIKPTYVFEQSAKAKVLSKASIASWFNWFTKAVDEVEVKADVEIDTLWVDEKKVAHEEKVAAFPITFGALSLDQPKELVGNDLIGKEGGWFPGVKCSLPQPTEEGQTCGTFWLKVMVTEKDPSNAKKYLEQGAEFVGGKKEDVVKLVTEKLGGKANSKSE